MYNAILHGIVLVGINKIIWLQKQSLNHFYIPHATIYQQVNHVLLFKSLIQIDSLLALH